MTSVSLGVVTMGATNQSIEGGNDERDVCETVRDALEDRIVCDVHTNADEQLAVAEMGRQYQWDTAKRIVREEAAPILGDEWTVSAYLSPSHDIEIYPPGRDHFLDITAVKSSAIGGVDIGGNVLGIVAGDLDAYLEERHVDSHDIPDTYSGWDEGWDDGVLNEASIIPGPIGVSLDESSAVQYGWYSRCVKAAVRILAGKGRFNGDDYEFHEAVPFGLLEGRDGAVIIAACLDEFDADDVSEPDFRYDDGGNVIDKDDIEMIGGGGP